MKKLTLLIVCMVFVTALFAESQHPFLILNESQLPALKQKAQTGDFELFYSNIVRDWNKGDWTQISPLSIQLSNATLIYAVEGDNDLRREVFNQILASFDSWETIIPTLGSSHGTTVYGASALFNAIIALDMIYNDCTAEQIAKAEASLAGAVKFYEIGKEKSGHQLQWKLARYGVLSTWYAYKQDEANLVYWAENYKRILLDESITSDGSWCQSPGYCMARMFGGRIAKSNSVDVLQAIGYYDFYADPRMKGLMNWLNHFALTPFGYTALFGESGDFNDYSNSAGFYFVNKYGREFSANSEYYLNGVIPSSKAVNTYLIFALMDDNRAEPKAPESILMTNTGAAFWQDSANKESLQGTLYSLVRENWGLNSFHHYSQDANSIGICGFGEFLIANGGTSYKFGYPGRTPENINLTSAWWQNVVTLGSETENESHSGGGGLIEGFIGGDIEYAKTSSGPEINRALHERSLFMLHPEDGVSEGYFAVYDKVNFAYHTTSANIHWQFNSLQGTMETEIEGLLYKAPANALVTPQRDGSEAISLYIATPAKSVRQEKSYKASHQNMHASDQIIVQYLPEREENNVKALTLLFPEDKTHHRPEIESINGDNFNGAIVTHKAGERDILIEGENRVESTFENLRFKADVVIYKERKDAIFSVGGGREFIATIGGEDYGFSCDDAIAMQLDGTEGQITTTSQPVTLYHPRAKKITIDGSKPQIIESGKGWVKVMLPSQTSKVSFK